MSVGTISSFESASASHSISGRALKTSPVTGQDDVPFDLSRTVTTQVEFGTGAPAAATPTKGKINQCIEFIFTATKNTTTRLDLDGVLTSNVGDLLSTLTKVKKMDIEYLTTDQDATNGSASTGIITISASITNPITTTPLGAAQTFKLNPGAKFFWEDFINGFTVTGGSADGLDFAHSDTSADAKLRIRVWGEK